MSDLLSELHTRRQSWCKHYPEIFRLLIPTLCLVLFQSKIDSYKSKVTQLTRENTQRLDTYTVLLQEKKELEQMLNSRQKSLVGVENLSYPAFQSRQESIWDSWGSLLFMIVLSETFSNMFLRCLQPASKSTGLETEENAWSAFRVILVGVCPRTVILSKLVRLLLVTPPPPSHLNF